MTGKGPFHGMGLSNVGRMKKAIVSGHLPPRPKHTCELLDDFLWDLMQSCWKMDPELRPWMHQVVHRLKRGMIDWEDYSSSPSTITSALPSSLSIVGLGMHNGSLGSTKAASEPNLEFPREVEPLSPGGMSVTSTSDRSSLSQYRHSFATSYNDVTSDGDKPLPHRPVSRFLPSGPLQTPNRRDSAPTSLYSVETSFSQSQQSFPYDSYQPPVGIFHQSLLYKPLRPPRKPNRPNLENSPASPYPVYLPNRGYQESPLSSEQNLFQPPQVNDDGSVKYGTVPALVRRWFFETDCAYCFETALWLVIDLV
jgi:hypothetical protein